VLDPWSGSTTAVRSGHIGHRGLRTLSQRLPLDGPARFTVMGAPRVTLELRSGGRLLARAHPYGGRTRLSYLVCGQRRVTVRVRAVRGAGRFTLTVSRS
jgi:hypothetical protein